MSAVSAIGGAAASQTHHVKPHNNATENLQKIQEQAIAEHQAETVSVSKSNLNIHA